MKNREEIYNKYIRMVYSTAKSYVGNTSEAEDLCHDIFVDIFSGIENLKNERAEPNWVYTVSVNRCLSYKRSKRKLYLTGDISEVEEAATIEGDIGSEGEIRGEVGKALLKLPKKRRIIAALRFFEELSYAEIASITESSLALVKVEIHRARQVLSKELKGLWQ